MLRARVLSALRRDDIWSVDELEGSITLGAQWRDFGGSNQVRTLRGTIASVAVMSTPEGTEISYALRLSPIIYTLSLIIVAVLTLSTGSLPLFLLALLVFVLVLVIMQTSAAHALRRLLEQAAADQPAPEDSAR